MNPSGTHEVEVKASSLSEVKPAETSGASGCIDSVHKAKPSAEAKPSAAAKPSTTAKSSELPGVRGPLVIKIDNRIEVYAADIDTLDDDIWVNDVVVDAYFKVK